MAMRPRPFKEKCPKCGYSKIVRPESDVIDPRDYDFFCPKCGAKMEREEYVEEKGIIGVFKGVFE
jgi:predicted RNA-binding Zn-ribbon protein involved in translation (DUF1610 family)